jgi:hypothetical protein
MNEFCASKWWTVYQSMSPIASGVPRTPEVSFAIGFKAKWVVTNWEKLG